MKIIFGSLKAQYQSVRLNGKYEQCLYKVPNTIIYLPQDGFLMEYLCFNDLIKIFNLASNLDYLMQIDEIRKNKTKKIGELSTGVRKLMEIATAFYSSNSYVLLDEPFSFLSPILVEKIIPHIKFQSQTKGIILSDHQYETVLSTCNK